MSTAVETPAIFLQKTLASGRIHSGYVISGVGEAAQSAAIEFARAIVCDGEPSETRPCEACRPCRLSGSPTEPVRIDGEGKKGPAFRHVGNHPDLYVVERGLEDSVIRVEQVRALQSSMRLAAREGGRRVAIIAEAEEMNLHSQNALLRLLEEPPPKTCLLLATNSVSSLLATIRSRCIRVALPAEKVCDLRGADTPESVRAIVARLDEIHGYGISELLDWAEEYKGRPILMADVINELLGTACDWLHERICRTVGEGATSVHAELEAYRTLMRCRREFSRHNTNSQMTAERGLFAVRGAIHS
jgi:DNA polymerase III delta prime subunit